MVTKIEIEKSKYDLILQESKSNLLDNPNHKLVKEAKDYLYKRGFEDSDIVNLPLGIWPDKLKLFQENPEYKKFAIKEGLICKTSQKSGKEEKDVEFELLSNRLVYFEKVNGRYDFVVGRSLNGHGEKHLKQAGKSTPLGFAENLNKEMCAVVDSWPKAYQLILRLNFPAVCTFGTPTKKQIELLKNSKAEKFIISDAETKGTDKEKNLARATDSLIIHINSNLDIDELYKQVGLVEFRKIINKGIKQAREKFRTTIYQGKGDYKWDTLKESSYLSLLNKVDVNFSLVVNKASDFLYLSEDTKFCLKVVLATVLENYSDNDPVWIQLIAPPSTAKTEIINALTGIPSNYEISNMTAKTLASGDKTTPDPSLLSNIGSFGILLFKDFTSNLNQPYQELNEIFSQLREVFDGSFIKRFGHGKVVEWRGKIGLILGVTPVIERFHREMSLMGERFLVCRIQDFNSDNEDKAMDKILSLDRNTDHQYRENFKEAVTEFVCSRLKAAKNMKMVLNEDHNECLKYCAAFISKSRSEVVRDKYEKDSIIVEPFKESSMRVLKQLKALLRGFCIVDDVNGPTEEHLNLLRKIAYQNAPPLRIAFFKNIPLEGRITRTELARKMGRNPRSRHYLRILEDMAVQDLIMSERKEKDDGKKEKEVHISLSSKTKEFLIKVKDNKNIPLQQDEVIKTNVNKGNIRDLNEMYPRSNPLYTTTRNNRKNEFIKAKTKKLKKVFKIPIKNLKERKN